MPNLDSSAIDSHMEPTYSEILELFSSIETNRSESNSFDRTESKYWKSSDSANSCLIRFDLVRLKKQEKF